MRDSGARLTTF
jgi:DTW domain-containing protein YfiP